MSLPFALGGKSRRRCRGRHGNTGPVAGAFMLWMGSSEQVMSAIEHSADERKS